MRAPSIPSYGIGAVTAPEIHSQTPQQARRALEAHQAVCPGPYRVNEPCDSPHNERWRKWASKHQELRQDLRVSEAISERPAVTLTIPRAEARPQTSLGDPRSDRKDAEYFAGKLRRRVAEMAGMVPDSHEWQIARSSAKNYRLRCINRAIADGVPVPELPEVPRLPLELCRPTGRQAVHDDPRHVSDRERHRRNYAGRATA